MKELVVQLEDNVSIKAIRQAIEMLKGVVTTRLKSDNFISSAKANIDELIKELPEDLQSVMGCVKLDTNDIQDDDRLQYILNK